MKTSVRYPEGHVLLRNLARDLPIVDRGEGVYLFDKAGKRYIDASGGAFVVSVGHGNREVAETIGRELARIGYVNGTHFTSEVTESLAARLVDKARAEMPGTALSRAAFLSSGSEVVEAAVKFARQLCMERGQGSRVKMIARVPSYHGNTLFALSMSGRPHYKKLYGPMLSEVVTTPSPYGYRSGLTDFARDGAAHYARLLEETILREGPETICAFIAEPVLGSSAAGSPPPPGYFEAVSAVCAKYGILTIADEVLCGAGRVGTFYASSLTRFSPDILVLGKGVGGGYAPLSVLLVKQAHVDEMKNGSGYFQHAQTYLQAPMMTAAGVAVLDYMDKHRVVENAASTGAHLQRKLREALEPLPGVGQVEGVGMLAGIELVADKTTKAPFPRAQKVTESLTKALFDAGVVTWPNVGQANGTDGDLVMLGPPLTMTPAEASELVAVLARVVATEMPDHLKKVRT